MDAVDMNLEFDVLFGQIVNYKGSRFETHEIENFLNAAQELFVEKTYGSEGNRDRTFFEANEKTRRELNELICDNNYTGGQFNTGSSALHDNAVFVEVESSFLYSLKEDCTVSYTNCNSVTASKNVKVKPVTHDEYLENINNPYKKPGEHVIWRMDYPGAATGAKKHELICDSSTSITNYHVRYLKRPQTIKISDNTPCELNESTHREIVSMAVKIAADAIKNRITTTVEPQKE